MVNNKIDREYKAIDNALYEQVKIGDGYVASMRNNERITVYWSSHLDLLKTLALARNTLGEPIEHMNAQAVFRDPSTDRQFKSDHHTPVVLNWANQLPTDSLQVPHNGMAVGWEKVPENLRDTMLEPYQIRVTAEQHIARATVYRLLLESGSPEFSHNLDSVLAGLEYDFKPLSHGESKRSDEWRAMHQAETAGDQQQAA